MDSLLEMVGDNGRFQAVAFCLIGTVSLMAGVLTMANVFAAAKQPFWCVDANVTNNVTRHVCTTTTVSRGENTSLATTRACTRWAFATEHHASTIQSHYDMVCEREYLIALCQTLFMVGFLIGCTTGGVLSDKKGRLRTLAVFTTLVAVFGSLCSLGPYAAVYMMGRIVVGACVGAFGTVRYTYISEVVCTRHRITYVMLQSVWRCLGYPVAAAIAYIARYHEYIDYVIAAPMLLLLGISVVLPESPRWLNSINRGPECTASLLRIARWNGRHVTRAELEAARQRILSNTVVAKVQTASVIDLFRQRGVRRVTLIMWLTFFAASFAYYGLLFASTHFTDNIFAYAAIGGLMEAASLVVGVVFGNRFGRVPLLVTSALIGGACCLACIPLIGWRSDAALVVPLAAVTLVGRMIVDVLFCAAWTYAAEVFPTTLRSTGSGSSSMCARVAGMLAPQVQLLSVRWRPLPFVVYGTLLIATAVATLFLPETHRKTPPDTVAEGEARYANYFIRKQCQRRRGFDRSTEIPMDHLQIT